MSLLPVMEGTPKPGGMYVCILNVQVLPDIGPGKTHYNVLASDN